MAALIAIGNADPPSRGRNAAPRLGLNQPVQKERATSLHQVQILQHELPWEGLIEDF